METIQLAEIGKTDGPCSSTTDEFDSASEMISCRSSGLSDMSWVTPLKEILLKQWTFSQIETDQP